MKRQPRREGRAQPVRPPPACCAMPSEHIFYTDASTDAHIFFTYALLRHALPSACKRL
jgi:hypothetical protein